MYATMTPGEAYCAMTRNAAAAAMAHIAESLHVQVPPAGQIGEQKTQQLCPVEKLSDLICHPDSSPWRENDRAPCTCIDCYHGCRWLKSSNTSQFSNRSNTYFCSPGCGYM